MNYAAMVNYGNTLAVIEHSVVLDLQYPICPISVVFVVVFLVSVWTTGRPLPQIPSLYFGHWYMSFLGFASISSACDISNVFFVFFLICKENMKIIGAL